MGAASAPIVCEIVKLQFGGGSLLTMRFAVRRSSSILRAPRPVAIIRSAYIFL